MSKIFNSNINQKHILIITCSKLCKKEGMIDYLKTKYSKVSVLSFPTHKTRNRNIIFTKYSQNQLILEKSLFSIPQKRLFMNFLALNLFFAFAIIWMLFLLRKKVDLVISEGLVNTFFALLICKFNLGKKVIYSSGDYFNNSKIFIRADNFISKRVYQVWSASSEMRDVRKSNNQKLFSSDELNYKDKIMPLGVSEKKFLRTPQQKSIQKNILLMGNIQKRLGYDLLLSAISENTELQAFHVIVVGDGEYFYEFKKKVDEKNMSKFFTFFGFIDDEVLIDIISTLCFVGIAIYDPSKLDHTYYSDPGKIKDYISRNLPVIISNSTTISNKIQKEKCGLIINYSQKELAHSILKISDIKLNEILTTNVSIFKSQFSWNKILDPLLLNIDI